MFVKGKSGNPGGRPKAEINLRELAQAKTIEALNTLASVMSDKKCPPAARVGAACALLDRGYGKPMQMVEQKLPPDLNMMAGEAMLTELARRIAFVLTVGSQKQSEESTARH